MSTLCKKPLIAITGPRRGAFGPRFLVALMVRLYGGRALQLRPGDAHDHPAIDGLIVTGGHDVDPVLYAAEPQVKPNHDKQRDALEVAVIKQALKAGVPILGICRGAQLLNVCLGGSLFQELTSHRQQTSSRWTVLPLKTLLPEPQSTIARLLGNQPSRINSLHNQAIDRPGNNLRPTGRDLDGIVQAVEHTRHKFIIGVQWHPEFLVYIPRQRRLFQALVEQAAKQKHSL